MNATPRTLLGLLGRPLDEPGVTRALAELGMLPAPGTEPQSGRLGTSSRELGLDIVFLFAERLRDESTLGVPATCLVTAGVFFHTDFFPGYRAYAGDLPYGLAFAQSRAVVRALLGEPKASSLKHKNDRWDFGAVYLTVDFKDDEQTIKLVTVGLPWKPRNPSLSATQP